jgi:hypothetical protein
MLPQADQNAPSAHQGVLAGIDNAPEMRDRILSLLRAYGDAGLGDREDKGWPSTAGNVQKQPVAPGWTERQRLREILAELRALKAALDR